MRSMPSCVEKGSRLTTTRTALPVSASTLEYAMIWSLAISWKRIWRSCCRAGLSRRMVLSSVRYGSSEVPFCSAAAKSRWRSWYFSLSWYSSLPSATGRSS